MFHSGSVCVIKIRVVIMRNTIIMVVMVILHSGNSAFWSFCILVIMIILRSGNSGNSAFW